RKHLKQIYGSRLNLTDPEFPEGRVVPVDQQFLNRILSDIRSHLDDSRYTIDALVKNSGLGRTVFFTKVKALTGMAPVELIRKVRLQHASQLLRTSRLLIKEIAYSVGFNDLKYFTACFKSRYGMTPSQYRETTPETSG
ncbi:MAG: helix-turn-helix transcriptional regulator, partial [Rikenellaceae bacterium]|nr:helix-turn-helix transcriptional regulator [Rikenellaceae bacterium]